jgi:hypothetical protein
VPYPYLLKKIIIIKEESSEVRGPSPWMKGVGAKSSRLFGVLSPTSILIN